MIVPHRYLLRLEVHPNAVADHPQGIDANWRGGGRAFDAAVPNIETGAMQGANKAISSQAPAFQLRHRMGTFILDGEEFVFGVTDQNVVAGYLERLAAAVRYLCDIGQILKIAFSQTDYSRRRFGVGILASTKDRQCGFLYPPMLLFLL